MFLFLKFFFNFTLIHCTLAISKHPILIIISFDAFRYNFFETENLPNLNRLKQNGVYSEYLNNVFPTKTFPNHHSIATGLYPESHGVIGNMYFDDRRNKIVNMSKEMYQYNDKVIPIWRWNEDFGDERYSGSIMWPGSSYPYQNKSITYSIPFNPNYDWYQRIDDVILWLTDAKKPANLVMLYFEEPDTHGHAFGPNSPTVKLFIEKLDKVTGYLHQQLKSHKLRDKVNVIHVSDHGMTAVTPLHFINITQYMKNGTYHWADASPAIQITPHENYDDVIPELLEAEAKKNGHYKVYRKADYPDSWHYKNNPRSPPVLVMADEGYAFDDLIINAPLYAKKYNFTLTNSSEFGVHGYDSALVKDMRPFFIAIGPKMKKNGLKVKPFDTVDLFNLFCEILEIPITNNNGSMNAVERVLIQPINIATILLITTGGILLTLILITFTIIFVLCIIKRHQKMKTKAALNRRFQPNVIIEAQHLLETEETY